jgi:hypothetical protein
VTVRYDEGVANHIGPEPCVAGCRWPCRRNTDTPLLRGAAVDPGAAGRTAGAGALLGGLPGAGMAVPAWVNGLTFLGWNERIGCGGLR